MPSTPSETEHPPSVNGTAPDAGLPNGVARTVRIRPLAPVAPPDTTDYELSASAVFPKSNAAKGSRAASFVEPEDDGSAKTPTTKVPLDPEARALFHQRLRVCCYVAAVPFTFFFACAVTNFIEPFGHQTVGWAGAGLAGTVLALLIGTAVMLLRSDPFEENILRVLEITIFGSMGAFFAYWQFALLTYQPMQAFDSTRHLQVYILAIALITHFNWVALMVFHGVLVPNSLARGVGVIMAMAAAALIIDAIACVVSDTTTSHRQILFAVAVPTLLAAGMLAVFGTAKTAALREQVEEARQALRALGQYRLRRKLGAGGMGEVYLAEHYLLKRPCAVKRIHPKYLDHPEQIRRFEREVQATAKLRHPNTIEIYDYGRAEDGTFYYVMEYLAGPSLEDLIARYGPMPADRVVYILRQVCSALREAHRHGLIHRDIKPSNIIILPGNNPHDQVKLVDFGLVHSTSWANDPDGKITRDGLIVGTPEYMSPEQAQGLALDERSDLFSVGSVAYYLLTGKEPFHRDTAMKTLLAVVSDQPVPVDQLNPYTPDDVLRLFPRLLAKDPASRYQSAHELDLALAQCTCAAGWTETKAEAWWTQVPKIDLGTDTDLDTLPLKARNSQT